MLLRHFFCDFCASTKWTKKLHRTLNRRPYIQCFVHASVLWGVIDTVRRIVWGAGSNVTVRCPSVCPSTGPQQQTHCCRFAVVSPASRRYRSNAAGRCLAAAAVGECGQCHVISMRRKLNTKSALAKKLTFKMNYAYPLESEADCARLLSRIW